MSTVIIEHVKVGDLPEAWRERLSKPSDARVTVRIDEETARREGEASQLNDGVEDPAFGIWRDRDDLADVHATCAGFARLDTGTAPVAGAEFRAGRHRRVDLALACLSAGGTSTRSLTPG